MGKLNDSLTNATTFVAGLEKTVASFTAKAEGLSKDGESWKKSGFAAVDELCLYLLEKLKKQNIDITTIPNALLKDYHDENVAQYLRGIQFAINEAAKYCDEFGGIANDEGFDRTLQATRDLLDDIAEQIRKKKKKLFQSKKFKTKIAKYDDTLGKLRNRVTEMQEALQLMRNAQPPSRQSLQRSLGFTENSKLRDILAGLSYKKKELHDNYNSLILKLNQTVEKIREEAEFASEMKVIKEMLTEANDMEAE